MTDPDDELALIVTELVTNAIRHAGPPVELTVAVADGVLDLTVTDHAPASAAGRARSHHRLNAHAHPRPSGAVPLADAPYIPKVPPVIFSHPVSDAPGSPRPRSGGAVRSTALRAQQPFEGLATDGRGLFIVDVLADSWALLPTSTGTRAWVRRALGERWPYQASCHCGPHHPSAVPLASGHVVVPTPLTGDTASPIGALR